MEISSPKHPFDLALIMKDYLSKDSKFTIKGLADFWGISEKALTSWLDNNYHLSDDVIKKIAAFVQGHHNQMDLSESHLSILRLRFYLTRNGIKQIEIARRLEVTPQTISGWLHERFPVPQKYIDKINSLFAYQPPDNKKMSLLDDILQSNLTDKHKSDLITVIKTIQNA